MAAVSQPGSRAGLITALVIFVVLFMLTATLWVVNMSESKEKEKRLTELQKKYERVVQQGELPTAYNEVEELRKDANNAGRSLYEILKQQRDELAKLITGQPVPSAKAMKDAADTIARINAEMDKAKANLRTPGSPLNGVMAALASGVIDRQRKMDEMAAQMADLNGQLQAKDQARAAESQANRDALEAAKNEAAAATKDAEAYRQSKDTQLSSLEKNVQAEIEAKAKLIEDLQAQVKATTDDLAKKDKELKRLVKKLTDIRPSSIMDVAMRYGDGKIIQVNKNNVVYINLGSGQQISPGMTFEIFDRVEGVPPMAEGSDVLPVGKGSLEVIHVSQGSSECRVVKTQPGMQIVEGDIIANLIYDPKVKWAFKVYGNFDIDQNGVATAGEADIAKRLVVQWGGKLTEQVNMDTDFVILGKEPVLPNYTAEQRSDNPLLDHEYKQAEAALKAYDDVKHAALDLNIPVLSQNRFLYMIGFYDQARK